MTSPKTTEFKGYVRNGRHLIQQKPGTPSEESPNGLPCRRLPQKLLRLPHRNRQPHQHRSRSSTNAQPSSCWPRRQQGLEAGRDLRYRALVALYLGKKKSTFGTEKLREEPGEKNEGRKIIFAFKWLGRAPGVKARFRGGAVVGSSATFPDVVKDGFNRLRETDRFTAHGPSLGRQGL